MHQSHQQSVPRWETRVFEVANTNTVLSALFYILFGEGHFTTDPSTLRAGLGLQDSRDQAIFEALKDFVAHIPPPESIESEESMTQFAASGQRLDHLIPGASKRLAQFIAGNPGYLYSTWSPEMIIVDKAQLGWQFVSQEPIIQDGLRTGTAYTFRRPVT